MGSKRRLLQSTKYQAPSASRRMTDVAVPPPCLTKTASGSRQAKAMARSPPSHQLEGRCPSCSIPSTPDQPSISACLTSGLVTFPPPSTLRLRTAMAVRSWVHPCPENPPDASWVDPYTFAEGTETKLPNPRSEVEAGVELLDREQEIAEISALLEGARSGAGRVLVIEGPSGIGKTELLRRTRALARERGFLALWATGAEVERDFVYGVVRQLFEQPLAQASSEQRASLLSGAASLARIAFESVPGPLEAPASGLGGSDFGASGATGAVAVGGGAATGGPSFPGVPGPYLPCANPAAPAPGGGAVGDGHRARPASM